MVWRADRWIDLRRSTAERSLRLARRLHFSFPGMVLALGFLCMSLTPSLLPRNWLVQGLVSGLSAATGYGLGTVLGWLFGKVVKRTPPPGVRRIAWQGLTVIAGPSGPVLGYQGSPWQRDLYPLIGEAPPARPR